MYSAKFVAQDPATGQSSKILEAIREVSSAADFDYFRASVAYATIAGCRLLSSAVDAMSSLDSQTQFLISIDFGLTEPDALKYLQDLPGSTVRVPNGLAMLVDGLHPKTRFHPKTYVFDYQSPTKKTAYAMFSGSANLTGGGLVSNVEHGVSQLWISSSSKRERDSLEAMRTSFEWWNRAWEQADEVNKDFIKQYRKIRPNPAAIDDPPIVRDLNKRSEKEVTFAEGLGWSQARCFWIETHELYKCLGPNRAGNQLDCRRGTRVFFGFSPTAVVKNTVLGHVYLRYENNPYSRKSVRFANNMMDKVNLPLPDTEGPSSYDNAYLHFERVKPGRYQLKLGSQRAVKEWIMQLLFCKFGHPSSAC